MRRVWPTLATLCLFGSQLPAQEADSLHKGDWQTYSGAFASHRHSPLAQISTANVASLRPVWMYQPLGTGPLEGTPDRRERCDVHHLGARRRRGTQPEERTTTVAVDASDLRRCAQSWLPAREPRCRHPRRHGVCRHARRLPRRTGCQQRGRALGGACGRQRGRPRDHGGAAHRREQGDRRHQRRRGRHPRIPGCVQREDREAGVALLDDPRAG